MNSHRGHLDAGLLDFLLEDNLSELVVAHHCLSGRKFPTSTMCIREETQEKLSPLQALGLLPA